MLVLLSRSAQTDLLSIRGLSQGIESFFKQSDVGARIIDETLVWPNDQLNVRNLKLNRIKGNRIAREL